MGADKALLVHDGVPLVMRVAEALRCAGATSVLAIGGDVTAIEALGVSAVPDCHPGEGPLGGIVQAIAQLGDEDPLVVVLACDLPWVCADAVRDLVQSVGREAVGAVTVLDGRREPLAAAWSREAFPMLSAAFEAGERSPTRAMGDLGLVDVVPRDRLWFRDADTPEDLRSSGQS